MKPIRYEHGIPVFSKNDVDDYGLPDQWGYEQYEVVESRDTQQMTTDYKMEQQYYKRPIHRYVREERFRKTLEYLLGDRGTVPKEVIQIVQSFLKGPDYWSATRKILKHFKMRLYYNRIPYIIQQITKTNSVGKIRAEQYEMMMYQFRMFCQWFQEQKHVFQRTYFPNMKFIALKLIQEQGIELNYTIPETQTLRKRKELDLIWSLFTSR